METTLLSLAHGFSVAFEPTNLWYAFLGCLVGTLGRRFAGHRAAGRHFDPAAGDIRPQRHAGHHHARRHLLRLAIWRLDHLDPDAHSGRSLVGDDLHRRLRHGKEGPRRRSALHCGGRLVDRRDRRRSGPHVGRAAARDHRAAVRAAGIHRPAGARPDLPCLYVVVVADQDVADGVSRACCSA